MAIILSLFWLKGHLKLVIGSLNCNRPECGVLKGKLVRKRFDEQILAVHLIQCSMVQRRMLPSEPAAQPPSAASASIGQRVAWLHPPTGLVLIGFQGA